MIYMLKLSIFEYFVKPIIGICGIIAIFGFLTGQPIEPMISSTIGSASQIALTVYNAASEAIPLILDKLSEIDLQKDAPAALSALEET